MRCIRILILCLILNLVCQHKIGADRTESFQAVPADPNNRLKDIGPAREIEVGGFYDTLDGRLLT